MRLQEVLQVVHHLLPGILLLRGILHLLGILRLLGILQGILRRLLPGTFLRADRLVGVLLVVVLVVVRALHLVDRVCLALVRVLTRLHHRLCLRSF